ncbi:hypothetical protein DAPPUDRAFT_333115 [Daphnia pulex]|uniref:CxC3 like cysteine cluster domain-containing protein n=1 Tax=Daphnia pulex TaxID=6669 RepID=E9HRW7_DAPPU|nr:hypothetical protein DAPPUDRAFT_333115 [Daphnia pulex]|eukprot:EFX65524.1 hypothetical protein DAPPUDRAFT_333115 [Daphnia pulex]
MRLRGLYQKKKTTPSVSNYQKKKSDTELSQSSIPSAVDNVVEDCYNHVNEKVNFIESQESYIAEEAEESLNPKSDWTHRVSEIHQDWASVKQNFLEAFVSSQRFVASWCADCQDPVLQHYILAVAVVERRDVKNVINYFTNQNHFTCVPYIPVPCFSALFDCKKCKCLTAYTVTAGKKRVVIITKDGRFDLHFPQFTCAECGEQQCANEADFVGAHA